MIIINVYIYLTIFAWLYIGFSVLMALRAAAGALKQSVGKTGG